MAEKTAFLDSFARSKAGEHSWLQGRIEHLVGGFFRDGRTRTDIFEQTGASQRWKQFCLYQGRRYPHTFQDMEGTFAEVAERLAVYDSAQSLLGLTLMSDMGFYLLNARPLINHRSDPQNKDGASQEFTNSLSKFSAARNPDFWHNYGYWHFFQEQPSPLKDALVRIKDQYLEGITENDLKTSLWSQAFSIEVTDPDMIPVYLFEKQIEVPKDPVRRVEHVKYVLSKDYITESTWREMMVFSEADKLLIVARMLLSPNEMQQFLEKKLDQGLAQISSDRDYRTKMVELRRYILEDLGWGDMYNDSGEPNFDSFKGNQPFWKRDGINAGTARHNWEVEAFRRFSLQHKLIPESEAELFNVVCQFLKS